MLKIEQVLVQSKRSSCVTPAGASTSLAFRINGMTTHAHHGKGKHFEHVIQIKTKISWS